MHLVAAWNHLFFTMNNSGFQHSSLLFSDFPASYIGYFGGLHICAMNVSCHRSVIPRQEGINSSGC